MDELLKEGAGCAPSSGLARPATEQAAQQTGYRCQQAAIVVACSSGTARVHAARSSHVNRDACPTQQSSRQATDQACHRSEQATIGSIATGQTAGQPADQIGDRGEQATIGGITTGQTARQATDQIGDRGEQATIGGITTGQTARQA